MNINDVQITLDASVQNIKLVGYASLIDDRVHCLRIEPDPANSHIIKVLGPNGSVIKTIEPLVASQYRIDAFEICGGPGNQVHLSQISLQGTSSEKANVAVYLG